MSFTFAHLWPWMGLGAALLLAVLLATDALRSDLARPRRHDLAWLTWAAMLAYLVHQFEEHGIDLEGAPYAFRGELCSMTGFADAAACPVPESFITSVNVAAVWLAGPAAALLARRWPLAALGFYSIPFINVFAHLGPAIRSGDYNPGLLTAVCVFLPLSLWTFHVAVARYGLGLRAIAATAAAGIVVHAVLMGSLFAYIGGRIGPVTLDALQVINPALALLLVLRLGRRRRDQAANF